MRVRKSGVLAGTIAAGVMGLLSAPAAGAATQLGATFPPDGGCANGVTHIQSVSPGSSYAAPSPGVLTSWSYHAPVGASQVKLKVARHAGGDNYTTVGEGALETPSPGIVNTFPARISVQAGDMIGLYVASGSSCFESTPPPGYGFVYIGADPAPGTTQSYQGVPPIPYQMEVSATLELDCDEDGLGDETQDGDLLACDKTAPSAAITSGPKDKTKKKTATFAFTGSDARAVSGFQCSLDGGAFAACSSPHTVKVKRGRHTFQVRAVDLSGNVGAAVTDDWKVKKKKKKK